MQKIIAKINSQFTPLQIILGLGILFRLLAVIFSKGFGWFDDHFLIIESSQSWVDGYDYNDWLPAANDPNRLPQGHPLFYPGIHYFIFKLFTNIGITDPQNKMYFIRLLHAGWSLLIIIYGYKIAEKISTKKVALYVAGFLSLYWFMPFLSVRNLAELVCVPPLFIATWLLLNSGKEKYYQLFFYAGVWLGIAFAIRYQSLFYSIGIAVSLIIYKNKIKQLIVCLLGFLIVFLLTQGLVDLIIWKKPFVEFITYVKYNLNNAELYGTDNCHMYFDLIFGLLIPPLSILLFTGWIFNWKKNPILFWPVLIYLIFHTCFPNRQERFVVTILPGLIMAGTIGMFDLYERYKDNASTGSAFAKLFKFSKVFVILINVIFLMVFSVTYSKRNRVEAMYFLHEQADLKMVMIEDGNKKNDFTMPPLFYLGKWGSVLGIHKKRGVAQVLDIYNQTPDSIRPNYVVFWQQENIEARVDSFKKYFPNTKYLSTIEPGFIDKTFHWLNPLNDNETTYIYKINE